MSIRVMVADDHPVVLSGLESVLRQEAGFDLVGKCGDGASVVPAVLARHPDVLLLDLHLPDKSGLAVVRELNEHVTAVRVVLLSGVVTEDEVVEALRLGVKGILLKEMAPRLLLECIRKVHAGGQWLEKASIGRVLDKMLKREDAAQRLSAILTRRQTEIMLLVTQNLTNEEIASRLFIAPGTVKLHVHMIYKKLGVTGRTELARFARENGLT